MSSGARYYVRHLSYSGGANTSFSSLTEDDRKAIKTAKEDLHRPRPNYREVAQVVLNGINPLHKEADPATIAPFEAFFSVPTGLETPSKPRTTNSFERSLLPTAPRGVPPQQIDSEQLSGNDAETHRDRGLPDSDLIGPLHSRRQSSPSFQSTATLRGGTWDHTLTPTISDNSTIHMGKPVKVYTLQKRGDWRQEKLSHADIQQRLAKLDLDPTGALDKKLKLSMKHQTRIDAIQMKVNSEETSQDNYEWSLRQLELKEKRLAGLSLGRSWSLLAIIVYLERQAQQLQLDDPASSHVNLVDKLGSPLLDQAIAAEAPAHAAEEESKDDIFGSAPPPGSFPEPEEPPASATPTAAQPVLEERTESHSESSKPPAVLDGSHLPIPDEAGSMVIDRSRNQWCKTATVKAEDDPFSEFADLTGMKRSRKGFQNEKKKKARSTRFQGISSDIWLEPLFVDWPSSPNSPTPSHNRPQTGTVPANAECSHRPPPQDQAQLVARAFYPPDHHQTPSTLLPVPPVEDQLSASDGEGLGIDVDLGLVGGSYNSKLTYDSNTASLPGRSTSLHNHDRPLPPGPEYSSMLSQQFLFVPSQVNVQHSYSPSADSRVIRESFYNTQPPLTTQQQVKRSNRESSRTTMPSVQLLKWSRMDAAEERKRAPEHQHQQQSASSQLGTPFKGYETSTLHSENASLAPEAALLPVPDWRQFRQHQHQHRRSPSVYSDVSSAGGPTDLCVSDSFDLVDSGRGSPHEVPAGLPTTSAVAASRLDEDLIEQLALLLTPVRPGISLNTPTLMGV